MARGSRPTAEDGAEAMRIALTGLAEGRDLDELSRELVVLHPRHNTFPAEVLIGLSADVLEEAAPARAQPIEFEGAIDRVLEGFSFRGREQQKLRAVLLLGPAVKAGVQPDLLELIYWWNTDDLYQYALFALAVHAQLAAETAGITVAELCRRVAARHAVAV